jgi:hypothetical protein
MRPVPQPEEMIDKDEAIRLIVRTNLLSTLKPTEQHTWNSSFRFMGKPWLSATRTEDDVWTLASLAGRTKASVPTQHET